MSRFSAVDLPMAGLKRIERQRLADDRGFLSRIFCSEELGGWGWKGQIEQVNHTYTRSKGTLRGLHFQRNPYSEIKLVSVLHGSVWDVAVDLRRDSATYLQWHGEVLSADNCRALLIPQGFAHGFQTLTDDVDIVYCHSAPYQAGAEAGLSALDATIGIEWPLPVTEMSSRDKAHPHVDSSFIGV